MKKAIFSVTVLASAMAATSAQAILVKDVTDTNVLAQTIAGSGINISNIEYKGKKRAAGFFSKGLESGLNLKEGIILSTGSAKGVQGPNNDTGFSINNGTAGDSDLDKLTTPNKTRDANSLSFDFDFKTDKRDVFFNFQFGSEEYKEYVDSTFNDAFAFYLDGKNIAKLNNGTAITINNINHKRNTEFFIDNTDKKFNIQMDGFTKAIQISAKDLSSGTHRMKFAIADTGDNRLDSWILLGAKSFSNIKPPVDPGNGNGGGGNNGGGTAVSEPGTLALFALSGLGIWLQRRRRKVNEPS